MDNQQAGSHFGGKAGNECNNGSGQLHANTAVPRRKHNARDAGLQGALTSGLRHNE